MKSAAVVVALLLCFVERPQPAKIEELLQYGKKFDAKEVVTRGFVADFEQRISRAGNAYFVFKLKADTKPKAKWVNVYGRGKLDPAAKNGQNVDVTGTYRVEKKVGSSTFKNEIETRAVGGVKLVD
jgi:hypothetical protein